MVFSSYIFLFAFLPLVLLGYYLLSRLKRTIYQRLFLIGASLFFYGYFNPSYLLIIVVSIFVNYLLAACISGGKGRFQTVCFWLGVLFNVGLLGYFKYRDFFVENINALFHTSFLLKHIALPLGISFFTFQQIWCIKEVYTGAFRPESTGSFLLYDFFFPSVTSGPILKPENFFPQLTEERRKELVKQIRKYAENGKVAIRNIRRDAMESFKKKEKASEITEDDLKQAEKDLQKLTDDSSKKIDELLARKEKELMEI